MSLPYYRAGLFVALLAATPAFAQNRTLVSNGYEYVQTGDFGAISGDSAIRPVGTFTDQLFKNSWYYRGGAGTFSNGVRIMSSLLSPTFTQVSPNAGRWTWLDNGPGNVPKFDAVLELQFDRVAGSSPAQTNVKQAMTITNRSAFGNTMTFSLFNLVDIDLNTTATDDRIANPSVTPASIAFTQTDATVGTFADIRGFGASRYQSGTGLAMRGLFPNNALNQGSVLNLSNAGTPFGPGDGAVVVQWDLVLAPGQSATIFSAFALNSEAVPTPGAGLLAGLGLIAAGRRRR